MGFFWRKSSFPAAPDGKKPRAEPWWHKRSLTRLTEVLHEAETSSGTDFAQAKIGAEMIPPPHGMEETVPKPFSCSRFLVPAPAQEEGGAGDEFGAP